MISRVFEIGNGTQHDNTLGGHSAGRAGALGSASAATRYWTIRAGIYCVTMRHGFMEIPEIGAKIERILRMLQYLRKRIAADPYASSRLEEMSTIAS